MRECARLLGISKTTVGPIASMARVAGNAAALKLQHAGGIRHRRGHIVLLDRERPQKCACEQTTHGATAKMRLLLPFND